MKTTGMLAVAVLCALAASPSVAQPAERPMLAEGGRPNARIVIAEDPPRMVGLAARELQAYVEKIAGTELPIGAEADGELPVTVYVGRSEHTDRLGVTDEGLEDGAFRIVSGDDWLVLLGRDADFEPTPPFSMQPSPRHPDRARMLEEWDELTGSAYANPRGSPSRQYSRRMGLWAYDERGSLNAVYEFLRRLGVRWYMPGEDGEVVPKMAGIRLPEVDETIRPAVGLRCVTPLATVYASLREDDMLWHLRLGFNAHSDALGVAPHISHGLRNVLSRPEMKAAHPEYYAVIGGKRDTARNHACLSSEGLFEEAVRFARAMYDIYDAKTVSMMPEDGFIFCQCEKCEGKDTPERGRKGTYSDYVWGFVDRVAREVIKTHPDRTINGFSYGTYTLVPEKIDKFSPNVQVGIVHGRGWYFPDPPVQYERAGLEKSVMDVRREWLAKTDRPLIGWEHYPFTHRGTFLPIYFTGPIDAGLKAHGETSLGEFIEAAWGPMQVRGHGLHSPEFNHLNIYVTSRLHWRRDLDLDKLLEEYFRLFYGPAAQEMRAFVEYCEGNWAMMREDGERIARALALFESARAKAEAETVYARRMGMLADYLETLKLMGDQLSRKRENVPEARAQAVSGAEAEIEVDGMLEEAAWGPYLRQFRGHGLVDAKTGERPETRTSFLALWTRQGEGGSLYFGIQCEEPDTASLDPERDKVELLIETPSHSYYQLVVDAAGGLADFDRQGGQSNPQWSSRAEVATRVGENAWSVEIRVPVAGLDRLGDPLHELAGRSPSRDFPWHINVIRRRARDGEERQWIWSPTGSDDLYDAMKFGRLTAR